MADFSSLRFSWETLISSPVTLFAVVVGGFLLFVLLVAVASFVAGKAVARASFRAELKKAREDAVKRSRAVLGGQAGEQVAPFLPHFPCNPADARFVGKPIDFIAFPGAATDDEISEILVIEVKTGDAQLSAREHQIKRAVESGRVRYVEYRM